MKLTEEQKSIIRNIIKFNKKIQILSGYAGTGKSCVVQHLSQLLPDFAVCAYTGKAVNTLRKKNIDARTIHSTIYKSHKDEDGEVYFVRNDFVKCNGFIVDESSMVSKKIYDDLTYFNKPIIFVGDHGQLEPIDDKFNLMQNPDYRLEKIHRNAGEIAHFAEFIRNGYRPKAWQNRNGYSEKIIFLSKNNYKEVLKNVDQTICAYNKTRNKLNYETRELLGRKGEMPEVSDKIICLRNNSEKGLFNGMQGYIGWFHNKHIIEFVTDIGSFEVNMDLSMYNKVKYEINVEKDYPDPFDYAYAITCHKSISDQFNVILVIEQKCNLWNHARWAYTAATRAQSKIYWVEN